MFSVPSVSRVRIFVHRLRQHSRSTLAPTCGSRVCPGPGSLPFLSSRGGDRPVRGSETPAPGDTAARGEGGRREGDGLRPLPRPTPQGDGETPPQAETPAPGGVAPPAHVAVGDSWEMHAESRALLTVSVASQRPVRSTNSSHPISAGAAPRPWPEPAPPSTPSCPRSRGLPGARLSSQPETRVLAPAPEPQTRPGSAIQQSQDLGRGNNHLRSTAGLRTI